MTTRPLFPTLGAAEQVAPAPTSREAATREAWIRHYAAQALAAYAEFRDRIRTIEPNPQPGSRPDLGVLSLIATTSTAAAVGLIYTEDYAPGLIWDLTPEAGALNGEWEDWLDDVLVRHGVNPADIDPHLNPADFAVATA